jgi:hypothetical protein
MVVVISACERWSLHVRSSHAVLVALVVLLVGVYPSVTSASSFKLQSSLEFRTDRTRTSPINGTHLFIYQGNMMKSSTVKLRFQAPSATSQAATPLWMPVTTTIFSRGRRETIGFLGRSDEISLSLASSNPLWARWRYATLSFSSFMLHNTPMASTAFHTVRYDTTFQCQPPHPDKIFCDVGNVSVELLPSHEHLVNRSYQLIMSPDDTTSRLPQDLYFRIRRDNYVMRHSFAEYVDPSFGTVAVPPPSSTSPRIPGSSSALECLSLRTAPPLVQTLMICDDDLLQFSYQPDANSETIVIGGQFYASNYSRVQIDGWTGQVSVLFSATQSTINSTALDWISIAIVILTVLVFLHWSASPETLSASLYLLHDVFITAPSKRRWPIGPRLTWGTGVLGLCIIAAVIVTWMTLAAPTVPLTDVNFIVLAWTFTIYAAVQVLIALGLLFADIGEGGHCGVDWFAPHTSPLDAVLFRTMAYGTGALSTTALAGIPLSYQGGIGGDVIFMFLLLPILLPLIVMHTYYMVLCLAVQVRSGGRNIWAILGVVVEFILYLGLVAVVFYFFLVPLTDSTNSFFSGAGNIVAGMFFFLIAIALGCMVILLEIAAVLKKTQVTLRHVMQQDPQSPTSPLL